ncbi:MAG: slyD, partial [Deinococcus sp.]|nr:slyD [Deinococcus sp.]
MKITQDKVVEVEYKLRVNGETIDASEPGEPLTYLHGHGGIISGLERALEGKDVGDSLQVTVQPEDGYGLRDEDNIDVLGREDFDDDIEVGATYYAEDEDGQVVPFTVLELDGETVRVDFNVPLAGEVLDFDVTVLNVRDATAEELEHGHAHSSDTHSAGMHDHGDEVDILTIDAAELDGPETTATGETMTMKIAQ